MSTCKRACCWTPLTVCARNHQCPCHSAERLEESRLEKVWQQEQERLEKER